ncbi:MAG: lipase [Solirubrobacteraceae bacterium]
MIGSSALVAIPKGSAGGAGSVMMGAMRAATLRRFSRHAYLGLAVVLLALECCGSATAAAYAPVDQPGPPLDVPTATLRAALVCSPNVGQSEKEPVLLVPGTWATFQLQFQWNWALELTKLGIPWCGVSPPNHQSGDIQTAAEYDVYAIRYLYHASHDRRIAVVGHSQGGMQPRWPLRFWPDLRTMVADDVGVAPDNQGVSLYGLFPTVDGLCKAGGLCPLTAYQQAAGSNFIQALNSGQEMFPGIDYSVIYSTSDELVAPVDTPLHGAGSYSRTALRDVCPGHIADHALDGTTDAVSWALVLDAITHPGPASAARIPSAVCSEPHMPALTGTSAGTGLAMAAAGLAVDIAESPFSKGEPPLRCYVFATCPPSDRLTVTARPSRVEAGRRTKVTITVRVDVQGTISPVPDASVRSGAASLVTDEHGRAYVIVGPARAGTRSVSATAGQYLPGSVKITVVSARRRQA